MSKSTKEKWFIFKSLMKNIIGLLNYTIIKPIKWLLKKILSFLEWLLDWFISKLPLIAGIFVTLFAGGFVLFLLMSIIFAIRGCYLDNKQEKELDIREVEIVYYMNENNEKCVYTNFNNCSVINDKGMAIIYTTNTFGISSTMRDKKYWDKLVLPNYVIERKWIKRDESK